MEQATYQRGRVSTKVRYDPVQLVLDVPDNEVLPVWAANPHQQQVASVVFFDAAGGQPVETLRLPGAYCISYSYHEQFNSSDVSGGAYQCTLTLSDPAGWTIQAGGPARAYVAPAARSYAGAGFAEIKTENRRIANGPVLQTAFRKNKADPVRDVLGPGRLSHPEEWNETLAKLTSAGVEVVVTDKERLAYAPGTFPGSPGQVHLNENASIGALRHEYQHVLDDQAGGWLGTRGLYEVV